MKRTFTGRLRWLWDTRVLGLFRVRMKHAIRAVGRQPREVISFQRDNLCPIANGSDAITVILTGYRRMEYVEEQIDSLRRQTLAPAEIWIWMNASDDDKPDLSDRVDRIVISNSNWSFWGRFALANLVRTRFVALFDDDVLPGRRWLENCVATIEQGYDGILGGSGVLLPGQGGYSSKEKIGWNGCHLGHVAEVDLVGHAWFMDKKHVRYMWYEEPASWENGEDIHLSCMAKKHGGVKTFVPPHPEGEQDLWSCRPDFGKIVGRKKVATFKSKNHKDIRSQVVDRCRQAGWEILGQDLQAAGKDFHQDLEIFNDFLRSGVDFSLVRFGDGELAIVNGQAIDLSGKHHGEHRFVPGDERDERHRQILIESLRHSGESYFVGIPCRCCVGDEHCDRIIAQSGQDSSRLTWANIFVNANYPRFMASTLPLFAERRVFLVCNEKARVEQLPFPVEKAFFVGQNCWTNDYDRVLGEITAHIDDERIEGAVFLFCAGVLSNMLIYRLYATRPRNSYVDVGSVFDDLMGLGKTRKYLKGSRRRLKKKCIW